MMTDEQALEIEKKYSEQLQRKIDDLEEIVRNCISAHGRTLEQAWDAVPREKWEKLALEYLHRYKTEE